MSTHELPSGAELEVTPLDFGDSFAVFQQVSKVLGLIEIDFDKIDLTKDIKAAALMEFKRPLAQLLSNQELVKCGNQCLKKCTYNGVKIGDKTFDVVEARQDYLFAIFFALKENVSPFLDGVFSGLKA